MGRLLRRVHKTSEDVMEAIAQLAQAKNELQLALGMLVILLLAVVWGIRYITAREAAYAKELQQLHEAHMSQVEILNKAHSEQVDKLYANQSAAVERLIEAHRREITASISSLTSAINQLNIIIGRRQVDTFTGVS